MEDRLIFPTSIEQVGTSELIHTTFSSCKWTNIEPQVFYMSDLQIDIAPAVFFEWAYQTPAGLGPILFYCLNLSMEFLVQPTDWMLDIVTRIRYAPKQLSDGR
jgi:hypothetical protein